MGNTISVETVKRAFEPILVNLSPDQQEGLRYVFKEAEDSERNKAVFAAFQQNVAQASQTALNQLNGTEPIALPGQVQNAPLLSGKKRPASRISASGDNLIRFMITTALTNGPLESVALREAVKPDSMVSYRYQLKRLRDEGAVAMEGTKRNAIYSLVPESDSVTHAGSAAKHGGAIKNRKNLRDAQSAEDHKKRFRGTIPKALKAGPLSAPELIEAVGCDREHRYPYLTVLRELRAEGIIKKRGSGRASRYSLPRGSRKK